MAGPVIGQRDWTCPDCFVAIPLKMVMKVRYDAANHPHHVVAVDNADVQAHTLMHELCACGWDIVEVRALTGQNVMHHATRIPSEHCTIHPKEEQ